MNDKILSLEKRKDAFHERNGKVIDMMNEGRLSVEDAKMILRINATEIERLSNIINFELQIALTGKELVIKL